LYNEDLLRILIQVMAAVYSCRGDSSFKPSRGKLFRVGLADYRKRISDIFFPLSLFGTLVSSGFEAFTLMVRSLV
jgi:hypothetical protein